MKKMLLVLFAIFILCGCSSKNKWDDYKHYNLNDKEPLLYSYYDEYTNVYAVADLTKNGADICESGFFYQVDKNDYVLLDTFESNCNKVSTHAVFYDDKLYIINGLSRSIYSYKLNHEKVEKEEIPFKARKVFSVTELKKIENGKIYLNAQTSDDEGKTAVVSANVVCELSTFKCEINDIKND